MSARFQFSRQGAVALGLLAFMSVGVAHAADAIDAPPQPAEAMELPVASWTGGYAGVTAGYGFAGESQGKGANVDTDGFVGGGFIGYNQELGNGVVLGGEGDVGYSGVEGNDSGVRVKSGVDGSLRARLGYTVTPDILGYVTGGGAAKHMSVRQGGDEDSATQVGWTAGVGTDVKLTEKVFGRVEYRYSDYGSAEFNTGSGTQKVDASDHRIQMGVGFQF